MMNNNTVKANEEMAKAVAVAAVEETNAMKYIKKDLDKMTKKDYFSGLLEMMKEIQIDEVEKGLFVSFIENQIELLDTRYSKSREKKDNDERVVLLPLIKEVIGEKPHDKFTIADLTGDYRLKKYTKKVKGENVEVEMSPQKMAALLKILIESGEVKKTMENKKVHYSMA